MKPLTSTGYAPDFDVDNRRGAVGENLVGTVLEAAALSTIEVKTDWGAWRTGNHYVETWQQGRDGEWRPSGLNTTKASWWAIAGPTGRGLLIVPVELLRELAAEAPESAQPISSSSTSATRGRLVQLEAIVAAVFARADA